MLERLTSRAMGLLVMIFIALLARPYIPEAIMMLRAGVDSVFEDLGLPSSQMSYVLAGLGILMAIGSLVRFVRWRQNQGEARYRVAQQRRVRRSPRRSAEDVPLYGRRKRRKDSDPPLRF